MLFAGFGCKQPEPAAAIRLAYTVSILKIAGLAPAILNDIDRDSVKNWESLFAIYRLPADTNLKDYQPIKPGRYRVQGNVLYFTPDTPFVKQQQYFVRYYNYSGHKSIWDYLKGKTAKGQLHYTDLIFKP